jgi:hypothetical protein
VPTLAAVIGADRALKHSPQRQLLMVLGGTGLRMMSALGAGMVLYLAVPYFRDQGPMAFWGWILVFYLFTLVLEIALLTGRAE